MIIKVPGKVRDKLSAIVKEMGGEVVSMSLSSRTFKKVKLFNEIKQALKEVKEIRYRKAKAYSMSDLFDSK